MCDDSTGLLQKVTSFGSDVPTTSMQWKKEGNRLEWIVRQMSWNPPWCEHISDPFHETYHRKEGQELGTCASDSEPAGDGNGTTPRCTVPTQQMHEPSQGTDADGADIVNAGSRGQEKSGSACDVDINNFPIKVKSVETVE